MAILGCVEWLGPALAACAALGFATRGVRGTGAPVLQPVRVRRR